MGMEWIQSHYMQGAHDSDYVDHRILGGDAVLTDRRLHVSAETQWRRPSKTPVNFYQTRQSEIPAEDNLYLTVLAQIKRRGIVKEVLNISTS